MADKQNSRFAKLYYNARKSGSYGGLSGFSKVLPVKDVHKAEAWLNTQNPYLLHKPVYKKIKRRKIIAGFEQQLQGDLIDVSNSAKQNDGTTFLLTVIDVFSKRAWVEPLVRKSGKCVTEAFSKILSEMGYRPIYFSSDQGKEFTNKQFRSLLSKHKIVYFTRLDAEIKCAIIERFNRTLMGRIG